MAGTQFNVGLPGWLVGWFLVASPIVLYDATFLLLRPRTLPGGDLNWLWRLYDLYITVDKRYGDMADTFNIAQAWLNYVEVILSLLAVWLHWRRDGRSVPLAFLALAFTFWKTTIYMLQYTEACGGGAYHKHNDLFALIFLFIVPNCFWLAVPLLGLSSLWSTLCQSLRVHAKEQ